MISCLVLGLFFLHTSYFMCFLSRLSWANNPAYIWMNPYVTVRFWRSQDEYTPLASSFTFSFLYVFLSLRVWNFQERQLEPLTYNRGQLHLESDCLYLCPGEARESDPSRNSPSLFELVLSYMVTSKLEFNMKCIYVVFWAELRWSNLCMSSEFRIGCGSPRTNQEFASGTEMILEGLRAEGSL